MDDYTETGSDDERTNNGSAVQNDDGRQEIIESNASQSDDTRTRSRSPVVPIRERSWKSVNAFINYTSDFRKVYFENQNEAPGKINRTNLLKMAGEKWKQMTPEEKQPYIDGARRIRKLKKKNDKQEEKEEPQLKMKRPRKAAKNKSYREVDESKPKKKKKNKDIHYKNVIIKNISGSSSDSSRSGSKGSNASI